MPRLNETKAAIVEAVGSIDAAIEFLEKHPRMTVPADEARAILMRLRNLLDAIEQAGFQPDHKE